MATWRTAIRIPIFFLIFATLLLAAAIGFYMAQADARDDGARTSLTSHSTDQKPADEACENADERGQEEGHAFEEGCEEKPPEGRYGQPGDDDRGRDGRGRDDRD